MNKLNHVSAFVFVVLATVFIGKTVSAGTNFETLDTTRKTVIASLDLSTDCVAPLNRDYHAVLSAYNSDTSDEYKFSGCGGVI